MLLHFQLKNDSNLFLLKDALQVSEDFCRNAHAVLAAHARDLEVFNYSITDALVRRIETLKANEALQLHEDDLIAVYTACYLVSGMHEEDLETTLRRLLESGKLKSKFRAVLLVNYCDALKKDLENQELFSEIIRERKNYLETNLVAS